MLARNGPACKDAGLALLSEAFLRNKQLSLRTINISENGVDDKGYVLGSYFCISFRVFVDY